MNIEKRRKQIREKYFATGGLIIVTILGGFGLFFMYMAGIFEVTDFNMLYSCIYNEGVAVIFGLFFFIVFIYCWVLFFLNIVVSPKEEILYIYKNKKGEFYFINKNGRKIIHDVSKLKTERYYKVLKTRDYIYEVLGETSDTWMPEEKKSYWLNYYSPVGNFEDIFLLPILYVILLPGILSILMSKGFEKIFGVIYSIVPLFAIGYDLVYKIKLKKSSGNPISEIEFVKAYDIFIGILTCFCALFMSGIMIFIFMHFEDTTSRLIFSPFLIVSLCGSGNSFARVFRKPKLAELFHKGYLIVFLLFWFGMLSFATYNIINQGENLIILIFLITFWIVGFYVVYRFFIKK